MSCDRILIAHANVFTANAHVSSPYMLNRGYTVNDLHRDDMGKTGLNMDSPLNVPRCLLGKDLWPEPTGTHVYPKQTMDCRHVTIPNLIEVRHIYSMR